jgi:glycosyltransferase involved in cell wall biosynthesis
VNTSTHRARAQAKIRILAWPASNPNEGNPYPRLLYDAVEEFGPQVDPFLVRRLFTKKYAVWHMHWPEHFLNMEAWFTAVLIMGAKFLLMSWARRRGMRIVWTVHNLGAHEHRHPRLEALFWRGFTNRLDGFLALSNGGLLAARERFPALRTLPGFVVPHGHYRGEYSAGCSRQQARSLLGISSSRVLLFFGSIRPYKNVPQLVRAFKSFPDRNTLLFIAGEPSSAELARLIRSETASDARIRLHLAHVPSERVHVFLSAADLVILPFSEVLNSGSALLALSFDRPVLVPACGALTELAADVGHDWVRTYNGEIAAAEIQEALAWALETPRATQAPLDRFDWQQIGRLTTDAFAAILALTQRGRPVSSGVDLG